MKEYIIAFAGGFLLSWVVPIALYIAWVAFDAAVRIDPERMPKKQ